jgi:hypothetical protein
VVVSGSARGAAEATWCGCRINHATQPLQPMFNSRRCFDRPDLENLSGGQHDGSWRDRAVNGRRYAAFSAGFTGMIGASDFRVVQINTNGFRRQMIGQWNYALPSDINAQKHLASATIQSPTAVRI